MAYYACCCTVAAPRSPRHDTDEVAPIFPEGKGAHGQRVRNSMWLPRARSIAKSQDHHPYRRQLRTRRSSSANRTNSRTSLKGVANKQTMMFRYSMSPYSRPGLHLE